MNKIFIWLMLLSGLTVSGQTVINEEQAPIGFWVIENNIKTPRQSTVFFYNNDNILVYKETISGKRLNVKRKKVVRQLNGVLHQSLLAWHKEQVLRQDLRLVQSRR